MSIINLFLQKRKMHENQHGIIMVITAYALSVMMLFLGSDVFYNINSEAAGISKNYEETQEKINEELPKPQSAELTHLLIQSELQNPFGVAEVMQTGLGSTVIREVDTESVPAQDSTEDSTIWLMGNAMNQEEYNELMDQLPDFESVSIVVPSDKAAILGETEESSKNTEDISSLSSEEVSSPYVMDVTEKEIGMLERIVQAEAGGEDMVGKILIVNVIMNRIADESFPDSVEDVIFQNKDGEYQFSPVDDKSYWSVKISDNTKEAVIRALEGEDYSKGALYFIARKRTKSGSARWFDENLKWLFKHGGHEFYKEK
jgi:N-acetylmuramoyl-L-alanine amidase